MKYAASALKMTIVTMSQENVSGDVGLDIQAQHVKLNAQKAIMALDVMTPAVIVPKMTYVTMKQESVPVNVRQVMSAASV